MLIEVAAWREREAQERDVPRGRVLKDEVIGDIAVQAPTTTERLAGLRSLPKGFERSKWGRPARTRTRSEDAAAAGTPQATDQWPGHGGTAQGFVAHDET